MPSSQQTPNQILSQRLTPETLDYAVTLFNEGYDIHDLEQRESHFDEVAQLIGDLAVYQALADKVKTDRAIAEANAQDFMTKRSRESAIHMTEQGYAEVAPRFEDQVEDESRNRVFAFGPDYSQTLDGGHATAELTEKEGLQELYGFLSRFLNDTRKPDGEYIDSALAVQASSILENLTFVGEKEYEIAARGIAQYWKDYLDQNPDRQICALAAISDSEKYPGIRKSDNYLRDRILRTFNDEELEKYSGRIVPRLDDISAVPENTKVVLLDDWSISGSQLRRAYHTLTEDSDFDKFARAGSTEINLLVSCKERIDKGFVVQGMNQEKVILPVKAYYQSHYAPDAQYSHRGHVTGLHSTVNYDFQKPINKGMVKILDRVHKMRTRQPLISLANVVRPYRSELPEIQISGERLARINESK